MISQRRRIDPTASLHSPHIKLTLACESMAYQFPAYEVGAVIDWQSREILERGGDDEIVVADADDGWVRVETRYDIGAVSGG